MIDIAQEKIEDQFDYTLFFKNQRQIKHIYDNLILKENKEAIDDRLLFNIPSDDSDEEEEQKNHNDQLYDTENLAAVVEVQSSHLTTDESSVS